MAVAKTDLKFYLTGLQPGVAGTSGQSLGGYVTTTEVAPSSLLNSIITPDSTSLTTAAAVSAGHLLVGNELITQNSGTISAHGDLATTVVPHQSGLPVYQVGTPLFDNAFADDWSQCRCIAVTNINASSAFYALNFYFKLLSRNPDVGVQIAIEAPTTVAKTVSVSSGTTLSVTVSSLASVFADNYFQNCAVKITSGVNAGIVRVVQSYTGATGTFVFSSQTPLVTGAGDSMYVYPAPSQTIASGTLSPTITSNVSSWQTPTRAGTLGIDVNGYRTDQGLTGANLAANEVIYLWLKRTLKPNLAAFPGNRVIFTANYTTQ